MFNVVELTFKDSECAFKDFECRFSVFERKLYQEAATLS